MSILNFAMFPRRRMCIGLGGARAYANRATRYLRYTLDASWTSPEWPDGYWPAKTENVTDEMWQVSLDGFLSDLNELITLVQDSAVDSRRKSLMVTGELTCARYFSWRNHSAYHLGQIVQTRKLLGDWRE